MITGKVRFDESTYATLWNAIVKTNDKDLLSLFKECMHESVIPNHYEITDWVMNGILEDLHNYGNDIYKQIALYAL